VYLLENTPLPGWGISADVIWANKYERVEEKKEESMKKKGQRQKKKGKLQSKW
jgi:hypothetical protein